MVSGWVSLGWSDVSRVRTAHLTPKYGLGLGVSNSPDVWVGYERSGRVAFFSLGSGQAVHPDGQGGFEGSSCICSNISVNDI